MTPLLELQMQTTSSPCWTAIFIVIGALPKPNCMLLLTIVLSIRISLWQVISSILFPVVLMMLWSGVFLLQGTQNLGLTPCLAGFKQYNLYEVSDIITLGNAPNTPSHYSLHPSEPGDFLNWKDYLPKHVKPVKDMKKYHHFVCFKKNGVMTLQGKHKAVTESWTTLPMHHTEFDFNSFPSPVPLCPLKPKNQGPHCTAKVLCHQTSFVSLPTSN